MDTDRFVEEYLDVLQNLETAIVTVYRRRPGLLDYDVDAALETLAKRYAGEAGGRTPPDAPADEARREVHDALMSVCEWRLGRGEGPPGPGMPGPDPITADEAAACLKRLRKSLKRWNREGGRQGYLRFVARYLPY